MDTEHKISWMALRYSETKENRQLQIGLSFLLGLVLVGTIVFKNYMFGAFILIAAILVYEIKKREGEYISVDVHSKGISLNNIITEYNKISSFYIDENNDNNYLLLKFKDSVMNANKVIIIEPEVDIEQLRKFLLQNLIENPIKLTVVDKLVNAF